MTEIVRSASDYRPASQPLGRCTGDRSCPVRWRSGRDQACPDHRDPDISAAARELGISMSELAASAPGFPVTTPPAAS
jgi:hypothetical protein